MSNSSRIGNTELVDLLLSLIALTVGFAILGERRMPSVDVLFVSAIGTGTGFLLHELAHKFVAQRYGYWAEYRANRPGLILIIVMAFLGFILAAPGAVMIYKAHPRPEDAYWAGVSSGSPGQPEVERERKEELWISLAGPMTNIVLVIIFFALIMSGAATSGLWFGAVNFALFINLTLAAFNLLPFGPLDGAKVWRSSHIVWAVVAVPTILIAVPVYLGMI
ncbi:MAG: site-2 protease family protein [Methanotrichaceae archaeon]